MAKLDLLKLSASSIKTYEQCPRKYWYNYIDKPEVPIKEWDHLTLGNFVHEVLEHFHNILKKHKKRDQRKLMEYVCKEREKEMGKDGGPKFKLNEELRKQIRGMLMSYLEYLEENGVPNVQSNERRFSVYLDEDLLVRGVIDRIDLGVGDDPTRFHVVDYKTGKSKYLDEFQLLLYGIPLLEENPDLDIFKGSYLALKEDMKWLSYDISRTDVENVKEKIRSVARQIREDSTWQPKPQFLCRYCDFESICDASPDNQFKNFRGGEIGWD